MTPEIITDLLFDMYGNYVVQKALSLAQSEDQQFILSVNLYLKIRSLRL